MLYHKLVESHLQREGVAVADGYRSLSLRQLHHEAAQYNAYFTSLGLVQGDRVAVIDRNPIDTLLVLLACLAGGYVFVPINVQTDERIKAAILQDCSPRLLIEDVSALQNRDVREVERTVCSENAFVYLLYTSGTDGAPKGVAARQKQVLFCCETINERLRNNANDRILCSLPLSFDYGLYQIFLAFSSGATLYFNPGNLIQGIPYLLRRWEITALPLVPSAANLMIYAKLLSAKDCLSLRYISFTGEVLSVELLRQLRRLLPSTELIPMYGLTECKRVSIMPPGREDKIFAGSCGQPIDGITVQLQNVDLSTGVGELVVEGPNVMTYWNISDADSGKFSTNQVTGQRRLKTGDLFRIDNEGFLYFCGRNSGILKVCGYRVSTVWLENQAKAIDGVLEVAVLSCPDILIGEKPVFFLYLENEIELVRVKNMIGELPSYLHSSILYDWKKPLPKNINGKVDRNRLAQFVKETF